MRIRVVVPVATPVWNEETRLALVKVASRETELEVVSLDHGPTAIESEYETVLVASQVVREIRRAETEGCQGAIVYCFNDPGLRASKEVASIPVTGLMESSVIMVSAVADRYGILNPSWRDSSFTWSAIARFDSRRLVSVRALDLPVLDLGDQERLLDRARGIARRMVMEDQADAIVLGCGAMFGLDERLQEELGVPVIAPGKAAVKLVEALVGMGIAQSKRSFPEPTYNEVVP